MKTYSFVALCTCLALPVSSGIGLAADENVMENGIDKSWMPWVDPDNPDVIVLDPESNKGWRKRRDTSGDPQREAGVINPQRYSYGVGTHGFPTYYNAPMAFNSEDLKASGIEIAFFGSALDAQYLQGAKFAANKMRTLTDVTFWPTAAGTDPYLRVNYFENLKIADFGNAAANIAHNQKTLEEIATVIGEIHEGDAIGFSVGGTHAQMYAWIMALAKEHGPGNFAMFHVDAHYDAQAPSNGIFSHNGAMIRVGVDMGLIKGEDVVSWGLRSPVPTAEELEWMRENKHRYYTVAQLDTEGYEA
ncbi:MAG: arginase family protein, partial [Rhizobiaceae bacterium]